MGVNPTIKKGSATAVENAEKKNTVISPRSPLTAKILTHVYAKPDDAHRPRKGEEHEDDLGNGRTFPQEENGKEDGEEGGELVENGRVGDGGQVIDGVKVQDDAEEAERRTEKEPEKASLSRDPEFFLLKEEDEKDDDGREGVAEKDLLHDGKVSREVHEEVHAGETCRRTQDKQDPKSLFCRPVHGIIICCFQQNVKFLAQHKKTGASLAPVFG